ncbi:MAG: SemiSWEET transporter [Bacteroidota bacterium]
MDIEIIGLAAGFMTTVAFIPQVYQTWKSKSAKDLSLGMLLILIGGLILWLIYGINLNALSIILTNSSVLVLASILVFFKFKYGDQ